VTTAYDALLASSTPDFIVLAEVQPMEILATWTAAGGGLTNTYYCAFASQVATTVVNGGLYRRLDFVRQNATALTSRASSALVDANLGSYFQDTTTNRLYVSTTTGASPDTFALLGAWFTVFFSTDRVSITAQPLYAPIITGSLPTITAEKPDLVYGATITGRGELVLMNGDGLFDRLVQQWVWRNKKVTFKLGGGSLAYADFATVGTMRINSLQVDDEACRLRVEEPTSILNRSIPTKTFGDSGAGVSLGGEGVLSLCQPWIFGTPKDCRLPLTNTATETYSVADPFFLPAIVVVFDAVYAVHRTTRVRTTLANTDYSTGTTFIIITNVTYTNTTYEIWADLHLLTGATTAGGIILSLLRNLGEDTANIDTTALTALDAAAAASLGFYLSTATQAADVLRRIEQSVNAQVYVDETGKWTARLYDASSPADWTLSDNDFAAWTPEEDLQSVLNEVRVQYDGRHASGNYLEASSSDDRVLYGSETSDSHRVATYLRDADPASALANHLRFLKGTPANRVAFTMTGLTLMQAKIGDMVAVTRDRGPVARTGRLDGQLFEIVKLEKALAGADGAPQVSGVLEDLGGQTDRIFRLIASASTLTWSTATAAEKAIYGFLSDTNGYLDATDPLTRKGKVLC
jgi:hypothetical protein